MLLDFILQLSVKDVKTGKTYMFQIDKTLDDEKGTSGKQTLALTLSERKIQTYCKYFKGEVVKTLVK